jgi:hypothetical protein
MDERGTLPCTQTIGNGESKLQQRKMDLLVTIPLQPDDSKSLLPPPRTNGI